MSIQSVESIQPSPAASIQSGRKRKAQSKPRETCGEWLRKSLLRRAREEKSNWKQCAYWQTGYRLVIDGAPIRCAAFVKDWKPGNRKALGLGYDPWGLELERKS